MSEIYFENLFKQKQSMNLEVISLHYPLFRKRYEIKGNFVKSVLFLY